MTAITAGASSTDANNWKAVGSSDYRMQVRIAKSIQLELDGWVVSYRPLKGLSRMMGNYHVRLLGGEGP